ncbi:unnamed protein product [Diplocarpon coronariae]
MSPRQRNTNTPAPTGETRHSELRKGWRTGTSPSYTDAKSPALNAGPDY